MRTTMMACVLLLGTALAGAQVQSSSPIPGEPGTPPTFPRQQIPPDQTIPQAQTPQAPAPAQVPPEQEANPVGSSTPVNVEGCLSGSSGNFSLTDVNGRTYDLVGADSLLSKYVGHRVQVSGTADSERSSASTSSEVSPKPEETTQPETSVKPEEEQNEPVATPSPKPETSSGESRQRTLRVSDVKEVADSCSQGPQL